MLYVFLCGESPWPTGLPLHRLELAISEEEPRPPSRRVSGRTRARIAGDLDAITLRCLAKDPRERYASVVDLCEDLERHLAGLPIRARRTGLFGRGLRLARRRPSVPAIAVLLMIVLATAAVAWRLEQRDQGRHAELLSSVKERLGAARRWRGEGKFAAGNDELDAALTVLEGLPPQPALEAEILAQKALHTHWLGESERALELIEDAERELAAATSPDPELRQQVLGVRVLASEVARPSEVGEAARRSLEHAQAHLAPGNPQRVDAQLAWADELRRQGRGDEALEHLAEAVSELRKHKPRSALLPSLLNDRAIQLTQEGRLEEAVAELGEALEQLGWHYGDGQRNVAMLRLNLGSALDLLGRHGEASDEFKRALEATRALGFDSLIARSQQGLARALTALGDLEPAEAAAREAVELREPLGDEMLLLRSRCQLGIILLRRGKIGEAKPLLDGVFAEAELGMLYEEMASEAHQLLGSWLQDHDRTEEALPICARRSAWHAWSTRTTTRSCSSSRVGCWWRSSSDDVEKRSASAPARGTRISRAMGGRALARESNGSSARCARVELA